MKVVAEVHPQPPHSRTQQLKDAEQLAAIQSITGSWADNDDDTEAILPAGDRHNTEDKETYDDSDPPLTEPAALDKATYSAIAKMSLPKNMKDKGARKALADCQGADPDKVLHIYGSQNKKVPISFDTFQELNRKMATMLFATMRDKTLGRVSCGRPFYENNGGFVVYPCSDDNSLNWLKNNVKTVDISGQKFRAWGPTEEPETASFTTWLADAYSEIEVTPDILKESFLHNNPAAPPDFVITGIKDKSDKKGRLVVVEAGPDFTTYLQSKNHRLEYFIGDLEFRAAVETAPNPRPRRKPPTATTDSKHASRQHEATRDRQPDRHHERQNPEDERRRKNDSEEWQLAQSRKRKRSMAAKKDSDRHKLSSDKKPKAAAQPDRDKPNYTRKSDPDQKGHTKRSRRRSRTRSRSSSSSSGSGSSSADSDSSDQHNNDEDSDNDDF
jgi:hypothetical protein